MSLGGRGSMQKRNSSLKGRSSSLDRGRPSFDVKSRMSTVSGSNKRPSSEERKSVSNIPRWSNVNVAGVRRSSFMNEVKPRENRRLTDKAYQREKLSEMIQFLENTLFQGSYTVQKLLQMTKKDFEIIFQHLLRILYPNYTVKKLEDEAPKLLKDLMYPFIPNKSAFIYISRSNWPQLFGVLLFLVDLAKFKIRFNQSEILKPEEDDEYVEKKIFMQYLVQYFYGEDIEEEKDAALSEIILKLIENRYPGSVEDVQQEYAHLEDEIMQWEQRIKEVNAMINARRALEIDLKNYDDYLERMKKRIAEKLKDKEKWDAVLKAKDAEIAEEEAKLAVLQSRYDAQGFDGKKQREIIREQKKGLQTKLDAKKQETKESEHECWEVQMEITKLKSETTQMADRISQKISEFKSSVDSICRTCSFLQMDELTDLPDSSAKVQYLAKSNPAKFAKLKDQLSKSISVVSAANMDLSYKIHDMSMKKCEVIRNLKIKSSEKNQRTNDLQAKEKYSLETMRTLEKDLDQTLAQFEHLDAEITREKAEHADIREEFEAVKMLKEEKQQMLHKYLKEMKKTKDVYAKEMQDVVDLIEKSGHQINDVTSTYLK